ncbi:MAG: hypothetical protein MUE44_13190 [Oscillatoriaceae cyanobacterium Prado104]|nr:hypothetical protein [Oscillatoriaceae cyanobacterium Prado104]
MKATARTPAGLGSLQVRSRFSLSQHGCISQTPLYVNTYILTNSDLRRWCSNRKSELATLFSDLSH